jgi:hypothetical protein
MAQCVSRRLLLPMESASRSRAARRSANQKDTEEGLVGNHSMPSHSLRRRLVLILELIREVEAGQGAATAAGAMTNRSCRASAHPRHRPELFCGTGAHGAESLFRPIAARLPATSASRR